MALAASRSGKRDRTSATAPVTSGAAKLVPCTRQYPPGRAPSRFTAGADSTVAGPVSEPDHSGSAAAPAVPPPPVPPSAGAGPPPPWPATTPAVSPATATTPGSRAGYHTSALPEPDTTLPVHATTTTSCAAAYDSASARMSLRTAPPSDMFTTVAPWSTAQRSPPATTVASSYLLALSSTRTGRMRAPGAMPATPVPSSARPAISAATVVPWPTGSRRPSVLPSTKSAPGSTCPARSACDASTPESSTATVTPAPVAYRHAVFAPSAWSCHSPSRTQSACAATGANPTASASPSTNATSAVTAARTAARNVM